VRQVRIRALTNEATEAGQNAARAGADTLSFPHRNAAPGPYQVVSQLPERDGQLQYRVKSAYEPFYRTVKENELEV
jgi:hypothetical protein